MLSAVRLLLHCYLITPPAYLYVQQLHIELFVEKIQDFSVSFGFYVLGIDLNEMQTRFILTSRYRFNTLLASGAGIITIIKITQSQLAVGAPQSLEPM